MNLIYRCDLFKRLYTFSNSLLVFFWIVEKQFCSLYVPLLDDSQS